MIGSLVACGVPPWFMVAHSAGEVFEGLLDSLGRPVAEADRSAGAVFRIAAPWLPVPGSPALAIRSLRSGAGLGRTARLAAWAPAGVISTEPLKETVRRALPSGWPAEGNLWLVACDYATGERVVFGRPGAPPADERALIAQALRDRPDVVAERLVQGSAAKFADAERALFFPTVSALGAFGLAPYRQDTLNPTYSAVGVNVTVPLTNGNLFAARHAEASLRARAESERVRDLENHVARDVRLALLDAQSAFQRLDLTNQLLDQATQAQDLAQSRYDLGLSSIVELTQAQLNKTRAEIEQASARYDYQAHMAALRYQTGELR